jgi:hypothetical protein
MTAVGRNDACPCGSGRKYKRCCLERDQAKEHERRTSDEQLFKPAPEEEVDASIERVFDRLTAAATDEAADAHVEGLLDRFAELVEDDPLLAAVRFDSGAFFAAVAKALPTIGERRAAEAAQQLFDAAIPELADRRTVRRLSDQIRRAVEADALDETERDAVAAGLLCVEAVLAGEMAAAEAPTLEIVFNVQLGELAEREEGVAVDAATEERAQLAEVAGARRRADGDET